MVMAGIHHCYCIGHSETNKTKRIESFVFETIFFLAQTIIIRFGFFFFLLKSIIIIIIVSNNEKMRNKIILHSKQKQKKHRLPEWWSNLQSKLAWLYHHHWAIAKEATVFFRLWCSSVHHIHDFPLLFFSIDIFLQFDFKLYKWRHLLIEKKSMNSKCAINVKNWLNY